MISSNRKLTERVVGPTWEVRYCLRGPADRNSKLGVISQNPVDWDGSADSQPWTWLYRLSHEYWYLSSTWFQHKWSIWPTNFFFFLKKKHFHDVFRGMSQKEAKTFGVFYGALCWSRSVVHLTIWWWDYEVHRYINQLWCIVEISNFKKILKYD